MDPQLLQQIMQLLQQYGGGQMGGTGFGSKGFGGLLPHGPQGAPQGGAPSNAQLPSVTQAPPNQSPQQPNLGQQAQKNFNPMRLLGTPAPGGLAGMGLNA